MAIIPTVSAMGDSSNVVNKKMSKKKNKMPTSSGSKVEATVGLGTENGVTSTPSIKSVKNNV